MTKYEVTEYQSEKCTIRVHHPILTEEESKIRDKEIKAALVQFGRERRKQNVLSR